MHNGTQYHKALMFALIVVLLTPLISALDVLPERARHGHAYKTQLEFSSSTGCVFYYTTGFVY